jgi:hypothetical protein
MYPSEAQVACANRDLTGLFRALRGFYPRDPDLPVLRDLVHYALTDTPKLGRAAQTFLNSIAETKTLWLDPEKRPQSAGLTGYRLAGRDLDFLGEWQDAPMWGSVRALNHILLNEIRPTRRAAVVGTMRDDGIYVLEWVAHYLALGFEGIAIYTNDNADGSDALLRCLADHGVIAVIESETSGTVRPEVKAFEHASHLLHGLRDFEWVLFVDSDEFLNLAPQYGHSVQAVIDAVEALPADDRPSAILYEWLWFNSGMIFTRHPGLLAERFQHASHHFLTKALVRLPDLVSMRMQHVPALRDGCWMSDSLFQPLDPDRAQLARPPQYGGGRINHYWAKSFEEFSLKKARGDSLHLSDPRYRTEYHRTFTRFFEWNGAETPETYHPPDPVLLARVKDIIGRLRALDGVAALEAAVEERFLRLLRRYDGDGGLADIYRQIASERPVPSMATI